MNFLSLGEEILLTEVLFRFPLEIIGKLSQVCINLYEICKEEILWKFKAICDFSNIHELRSKEISWLEFYKYLIYLIRAPSIIYDNIVKVFPTSEEAIYGIIKHNQLCKVKNFMDNGKIITIFNPYNNYSVISLIHDLWELKVYPPPSEVELSDQEIVNILNSNGAGYSEVKSYSRERLKFYYRWVGITGKIKLSPEGEKEIYWQWYNKVVKELYLVMYEILSQRGYIINETLLTIQKS